MDHVFRSDELVAIRKESGLSQIDVARGTGISQSLMSRYETGGTAPTLAAAIALADFYGISYSDFVDRVFPKAEVA